ncbi:hypothetical protein AOLI_G00007540 [Acnodon oligacanthus]
MESDVWQLRGRGSSSLSRAKLCPVLADCFDPQSRRRVLTSSNLQREVMVLLTHWDRCVPYTTAFASFPCMAAQLSIRRNTKKNIDKNCTWGEKRSQAAHLSLKCTLWQEVTCTRIMVLFRAISDLHAVQCDLLNRDMSMLGKEGMQEFIRPVIRNSPGADTSWPRDGEPSGPDEPNKSLVSLWNIVWNTIQDRRTGRDYLTLQRREKANRS